MNVGSVFIGEWMFESVGDYLVGVNYFLCKFLLFWFDINRN